MGFSMIFFLCLNLLANLGSIMFCDSKNIYFKLRLKYYKWKLQKIKKRVEEKREATLKREQEKQISPGIQNMLERRRNADLPFERVPDDNEAVPIL
jgi:hypothetical protein